MTADSRPGPPLPHVALDEALAICLAMLEDEPQRFQRAATVWHARWCTHLPTLTLAEAQLALGAVKGLSGPDPVAGARQLRARCARHGLAEVVAVLDDWIERRRSADGGSA